MIGLRDRNAGGDVSRELGVRLPVVELHEVHARVFPPTVDSLVRHQMPDLENRRSYLGALKLAIHSIDRSRYPLRH